jgi:hypothetical protein
MRCWGVKNDWNEHYVRSSTYVRNIQDIPYVADVLVAPYARLILDARNDVIVLYVDAATKADKAIYDVGFDRRGAPN